MSSASGVNNSLTSKNKIEVSVITSAHQVSDARLHRIVLSLISHGINCEIIAPGNKQDAPLGANFKRAPFSKKFTGRIARDFLLPWKAQGKVVICLAPDLLPMTRLSTKIKKQFFSCDLFEDYLDLLNDRKWATGIAGLAGKIIAKSAVSIAANADLTSVADEQVRPLHAKHRIILKNLPSLEMLPDDYLNKSEGGWVPNGAKFFRNEKPTAIYIGDIRASRGLDWMLEIASQKSNWDFIFIGNANNVDRERISTHSNIKYLGPMSPKESWKYSIGSWIGLSLLQPTPAFKKAIPSKLYEYAAVGLPIISTNLPRPAKLIHEAHNGEIIENSQAAVAILSRLESDLPRLDSMAHNGINWIAQFMNSDSSYQEYFQAVNKALHQ